MRVLIVDNHPIVMAGCQFLVGANSDLELKGAFAAEAGLQLLAEWHPEIVVLDLQLAGHPAAGYMKRLLAADPAVHVIIFGSIDDPLTAAHMISLGAKAVVCKAEDPACVLVAISEIRAGNYYMSPQLAQKVATLRLAPQAKISSRVSDREREILSMLAAGKSMTEIAKTIDLSYKTISAICNRLRTRFEARTTIELVRIAVVLGIC